MSENTCSHHFFHIMYMIFIAIGEAKQFFFFSALIEVEVKAL
ncbi:MAG: hypothetical protein K0Q50_2614 [Vampirovibrio sp.]|jgi:hypothetical protein|nr:hypothetical protein [Vampirovibrio sp.]